jgi:hypothetical protein
MGLTQLLMQCVSGALLQGVKHPGCEAHYLPPGAEIKNAWNYMSTSPYKFIVRDIIKHRDNYFS